MNTSQHYHRNVNNYIHLILGPMYAEKSTNLLRQYRLSKKSGKNCILIKYAGDNRYTDEDYIATHDQLLSVEKALACAELKEAELNNNFIYADVICIDEIQFYPDGVEFCNKWRDLGKTVIACGLYADYLRNPFATIPLLIAIADKVEFFHSICHDCKQYNASASYRITNETEQTVIGGTDKYEPLCQLCYNTRMNIRAARPSLQTYANKLQAYADNIF